VADWATSLVLSPRVWLGVALAGTAVLLLVVSGALRERELKRAGGESPRAARGRKGGDKALPPASGGGQEPVVDDDMADIEAILRKRGIT
jgi:hypothetical protein